MRRLVEHLDAKSGGRGQRRAALCEHSRRQAVARLVGQLARLVGGLAQDDAALDGRRRARRHRRQPGHCSVLEPHGIVIGGLERRAVVVGDASRLRRAPGPPSAGGDARAAAASARRRAASRCCRAASAPVIAIRRSTSVVHDAAGAGADERHARRTPAGALRAEHQRLERLARKTRRGRARPRLRRRRPVPGQAHPRSSSCSKTGTTTRSASSSPDRLADRAVHVAFWCVICIGLIAYNHGSPASRPEEPPMAADFRSVALVRLTAVLAGVCVAGHGVTRAAAIRRRSEDGSEGSAESGRRQTAQSSTQGHAAAGLLAAPRARLDRRARRRRRRQRLLLPGDRVGLGRRHRVGELRRLRTRTRKARAPSGAASRPITPFSRAAPTA